MRVSRITVLSISLLVQLAAVMIFLQGFFPVKLNLQGFADWSYLPPEPTADIVDDIMNDHLSPGYLASKNVSSKNSEHIPPREYDRLILMVVDALRTDFIVERSEFNYTQTLIKSGQAIFYNAEAAPPTVTMPRIKALTTGSIPAFIDVIMNFDSSVLKEDNIITQLYLHGKKMIFYGDDTWLKMFPREFMRKEGVSSFFVTDFIEVDNNVSRHVPEELGVRDWDVMVLHYLGLDHLGHLSGDDSMFMEPKFRQMDAVIRMIHQAIVKETDRRTLFVVCSDHGMNERGNHGGASEHETSTPLVFMKSDHRIWPDYTVHHPFRRPEVQQLDLAPTLATLLGVPIPKNNLGTILGSTLTNLTLREQLHAFQLNVHQIYRVLVHNLPLFKREAGVLVYRRALKAHADWLLTRPSHPPTHQQYVQFERVLSMYVESGHLIRDKLSISMYSYDIHGLGTAIVILLLCCLVLVNCLFYQDFPFNLSADYSVISIALCILLILVQLTVCSSSVRSSTLCGQCPAWLVVSLVLLPLMALSVNFIRVSVIRDAKQAVKSMNLIDRLLLISLVLHVITLGATSFIEEEHQTWYFISITIFIILAAKTATKRLVIEKAKEKETFVNDERKYGIMFHDHDIKQRHQKPINPYKPFAPNENLLNDFEEHGVAVSVCACAVVLLLCRLLRAWNQTGVKWAYLPDIQDFLDKPVNKHYLSMTVAAALMVVAILVWIQVKVKLLKATLTLSLVLIYGVKAGMGDLTPVWAIHSQHGTTEAQLCTAILLVSFCLSVLWPPLCRSLSHQTTLVTDWDRVVFILHHSRLIALVYFLLLLRSHNIPVLALLVLVEYLLSKFIVQGAVLSDRAVTMVYLVMGHASFFLLGNSNSLSTIDLTSGFVGIQNFKPAIIALLIALSTYCGPLYWFVSLCYHFCRSARYKDADKWRKTCLLLSTFNPFTYREHITMIYRMMNEYLADVSNSYEQPFGERILDMSCVYALHRCISLTLYFILATLMRYHLFVWSVFSPKLLYESMQTLITSVAVYTGVLLYLMGTEKSG